MAPPPPVLCVLAGDSGTDAQRRCRRTAPSPRARRRLPRTGALAPAGLSARAPTMRHRCFSSSTVWAMLWNLCLCLGVAMGRSAAASLTTMGMSLVFVPCSPSTVVCRGGLCCATLLDATRCHATPPDAILGVATPLLSLSLPWVGDSIYTTPDLSPSPLHLSFTGSLETTSETRAPPHSPPSSKRRRSRSSSAPPPPSVRFCVSAR